MHPRDCNYLNTPYLTNFQIGHHTGTFTTCSLDELPLDRSYETHAARRFFNKPRAKKIIYAKTAAYGLNLKRNGTNEELSINTLSLSRASLSRMLNISPLFSFFVVAIHLVPWIWSISEYDVQEMFPYPSDSQHGPARPTTQRYELGLVDCRLFGICHTPLNITR